MKLNRSLNGPQVLGVIMLANAIGCAAFAVYDPTLARFALLGFSLWMGWRLWTVGTQRERDAKRPV